MSDDASGVIRAQSGPQESALASAADLVIFGGAAGGGKSYALLLSVIQHALMPTFSAEIFRRTFPELTMTGGLWPESEALFPHLGGASNQTDLRWRFPSGASVKFSHMQHAKDRFNWDGAQIPMIGFDQLESFEEIQFWYMFSRNRAPRGGVRPFIFATCNPVPDDDDVGGWLHRFVQWWIDPVTGLAIPERSGAIRWLARNDQGLVWGDSAAEVRDHVPGADPRSVTFIHSKLSDNAILERIDPGYRARLMLLPLVERERLLGACWNARPTAGKVFNWAWFSTVPAAPRDALRVRYWDKAGTEGGGKYSAGVRMAWADGVYYVEDVVRGQWSAHGRNRVIRQVAAADGDEVRIRFEQEPGSGGKESAEISVRELAGYDVRAATVTGDKVTRAGPLSAQAEAGNVKLVQGDWNEAYIKEHHAFPDGGYADQVDASSGAFNVLALLAGATLEVGTLGSGRPEARRVTLTG